MAIAQQMFAEIVRALVVLALVLFAVGVSSSARAEPGQGVPAYAASSSADFAIVYCGDGPGGNQAHGPCHACRADTATLPAPPCEAKSAYGAVQPVAYKVAVIRVGHDAASQWSQPRAPPSSL